MQSSPAGLGFRSSNDCPCIFGFYYKMRTPYILFGEFTWNDFLTQQDISDNSGADTSPETLMPALLELEEAYIELKDNPDFQKEFQYYLREYVGRPNPLYYAEHLTETLGGVQKYISNGKDLNHTGAHKINSAIGQILLARWMGKKRIIAENRCGTNTVVATANCRRKVRYGM